MATGIWGDYGVSKAGVAMLAKTVAKQLAPHGIRVNAISPGWIRTAEDTTTPEQVAKYARLRPRIPLGQDGGLSLHNWLDE
jgi:3-oxoacyl-[acyl-carrier protein] reductase